MHFGVEGGAGPAGTAMAVLVLWEGGERHRLASIVHCFVIVLDVQSMTRLSTLCMFMDAHTYHQMPYQSTTATSGPGSSPIPAWHRNLARGKGEHPGSLPPAPHLECLSSNRRERGGGGGCDTTRVMCLALFSLPLKGSGKIWNGK